MEIAAVAVEGAVTRFSLRKSRRAELLHGFFRDTCFRINICYPLEEGLHPISDPACPADVSCAEYVSLSALSPCEWLYFLRVMWADQITEGFQPSCLMFRFSLPVFTISSSI